jgi:hypothetical protein
MWGQPTSAVRRAQPGMHVWRGRPRLRAFVWRSASALRFRLPDFKTALAAQVRMHDSSGI